MNEAGVLIAAGGTGGHISPGLALYEEFRNAGVRALFLAGRRDARFSSLNDIARDDLNLYHAPHFSKNPARLLTFPFAFAGAVLFARGLMKKYNVAAVIGMGGYASAPALFAARMMKVPLYLCEQNSVPGRVTKFFEKHARKIYGTFAAAALYLNQKDKYLHAGNPIRKKVMVDARKEAARKAFNLGHASRVILVIGGSQGALSINELVFRLKKAYPEELKSVGIIWSTGELSYHNYKERIHNEIEGGSVYLSPFIDQVGLAYRAADVAISRSGAGVMMELAAMGLPSIQIPFPYAADNHQEKNADEFARAGAAVKVGSAEAAPEKVMPLLLDLLNNPRALKRMAERALSLAKVDASKVIVEDILGEIG
ncbi:MAG: undecaprenyldiphospho-muramoylpentapeptide beta-N-acetylglucosaminyltransferase [Spirochaetes bacterium RBG_16_49_21]|nr:MAG: undecaprenyldiphospho-muramoylpentapeptide beta-N-acetylglucosaminyltransferase [Spirochaetes bacterium RBG_16_49_21]